MRSLIRILLFVHKAQKRYKLWDQPYSPMRFKNFFKTSSRGLRSLVHYRAKLCRTKLSLGETISQAKFSSLDEQFVTFARRNKNKSVLQWSTSKPMSDFSHLDKLWLCCWAKLCRTKFSSGEIFVTFQKIRHFRPTKFLPIIRTQNASYW